MVIKLVFLKSLLLVTKKGRHYLASNFNNPEPDIQNTFCATTIVTIASLS